MVCQRRKGRRCPPWARKSHPEFGEVRSYLQRSALLNRCGWFEESRGGGGGGRLGSIKKDWTQNRQVSELTRVDFLKKERVRGGRKGLSRAR